MIEEKILTKLSSPFGSDAPGVFRILSWGFRRPKHFNRLDAMTGLVICILILGLVFERYYSYAMKGTDNRDSYQHLEINPPVVPVVRQITPRMLPPHQGPQYIVIVYSSTELHERLKHVDEFLVFPFQGQHIIFHTRLFLKAWLNDVSFNKILHFAMGWY